MIRFVVGVVMFGFFIMKFCFLIDVILGMAFNLWFSFFI